MAIQDDCIRKNPFDFPINDVINDDTEPKVPLTPAQEEELLKFMQDDPVYAKYYDEVVILLEIGLQISELCGLTETDLNFEKRFANVDHQLLRSTEDGYYIETPKTDSGFRQVLMSAAAYEAFQRVLKNRRDAKAIVPFPVSWTVKMKKKQKETQDILSYHTQAAGCSDKARAKASGGRQPIEECGRTGL